MIHGRRGSESAGRLNSSAFSAPVHAHQGCAQTGDRQDEPDRDHPAHDGKLETREHTPLGKHAARTELSVLLAIMATMPVIPAPMPAPRKIAWLLPDREDSAAEREPDEPVRSLASTRLSISAPIRSTKLSATASS